MTVSKSFTAVGVSDVLAVQVGETFSYALSGTFSATLVLERQDKGRGDWKTVVGPVTAAVSGTLLSEMPGKTHARYRWRCTARASGTAVTGLADVTTEVGTQITAPDGSVVFQATEDGPIVPSDKVFKATSPAFTTTQGAVHAIEATFTETAGAGVYTGSVAVPAGATLLDIIVNGVALWNPATSAAMDVGDADNPDGYFAGIDLKADDLLAGESISFAQAGGKAGAYIANSQVSPRYSATARVISGIVTVVGGSGSTGRTRMTVVYHLPVTADIVAATKV